ncbi:LOW QUALITY PROTEIN: Endonuclease Reverse transcriptase [Phytophthora megakarya]|uniref:Endonuclease Reverse transcriptase n=1 Tax=Phytophthora megakarya TaxID=4795 RepID=A0A225WXV4_9STRA|nr:LOW QUALITY PROTEIN: Endonuclease Reverse transcriptase [Phytophthora megakarya]
MRRFCTDSQSWVGALTSSDHKIVTADFVSSGIRRRRYRRPEPATSELALAQLHHDSSVRMTYRSTLRARLKAIQAAGSAGLRFWTQFTQLHHPPSINTHKRFTDPELEKLFTEQWHLRLRINNDPKAGVKALRTQRNLLLHHIRSRFKAITNTIIDEKVSQIETLSISSQMISAVCMLFRKRTACTALKDAEDTTRTPVEADATPRPLNAPMTEDELVVASRQLSNGRSPGPDRIPAELLKHGADLFAGPLSSLLNKGFSTGQHIQLGEGLLACLPKPYKPAGELSNLRPIVLLTCIRKAISLVVLKRMSTARAQRFREALYILGIDLFHVFDTIDRDQLLSILKEILDEDSIRLIRLLLSDTKLSLRSGGRILPTFVSNIGTPEDFICTHLDIVERIKNEAPAVFARWSLKMNISKTDLTLVQRHEVTGPNVVTSADPLDQETWCNTRKLGSLLGEIEDVSNRKQLAAAALRRMWVIWIRPNKAYVLPILLYNCGTWALTHAHLTGLESFHRQQQRKVLQLHYPRYISNANPYERCGVEPLRVKLLSGRWRLFVLRRSTAISANYFMTSYFNTSSADGWRGRRRTTLPQVLAVDFETIPDDYHLRNDFDLDKLRHLAQDRSSWRRLTPLKIARDRLVHDEDTHTEYTSALTTELVTDIATATDTVAHQWQDTLDTNNETALETVGHSDQTVKNHKYDDQCLAELSEKQHMHRFCIYNDINTTTAQLRFETNKLLHHIRDQCSDLASIRLEENVRHIESLSGSIQMYAADREVTKKCVPRIFLCATSGKYILRRSTTNKLVSDHSLHQFYVPSRRSISPDTRPRPLTRPIEAEESQSAFKRPNNGRASGPDEILGKRLKYEAEVLAPQKLSPWRYSPEFYLPSTDTSNRIKLVSDWAAALWMPFEHTHGCAHVFNTTVKHFTSLASIYYEHST